MPGLPAALGQVAAMLADTGHYIERNVEWCEAAKIEPCI